MEKLVCENCGGQIDRSTMKCPYCGTQYERTYCGTPVRFVVERPGVHRIRAVAMVADELSMHDPERATEFTMDKLRQGIADGLLSYMKMETERDPRHRCRIIRGEVRVIDPSWEV